jgi:hypothetical protein
MWFLACRICVEIISTLLRAWSADILPKIIIVVAGVIALAAPAHAFTYFSEGATTGRSPGDPGASAGQTTVVTFDTGALSGTLPTAGVTTSIGDGITETISGAVGLFTGSTRRIAANPTGDTTQYEAVEKNGSATFNFAGYEKTHTINSLSVYLGSIDSYNKLTFLNAQGGVIATVAGNELPADNGDQGASITNRRVFFTFAPSEEFTSVVFSSSGYSLEYDSIAVGEAKFNYANGATPETAAPTSVPEPASWALTLAGFGVAGAGLRRRRFGHA